MRFTPNYNATRWLALFDLLGTRDLLAAGKELQVFLAYEQAVDELRRRGDRNATIQQTWFSDTFVIIGPDDSGPSFAWVDRMSRWFVYFLLQAQIPLRGAISCGRVYADFDEGIFFGRGLVEAYEYGDGQDWIGLLLCPSATERLEALGLPASGRLNYTFADVPWKRPPRGAPAHLPACILGNWITVNDRNPCLDALQAMASHIAAVPVREKYLRAIAFIEANRRMPLQNG